MDTFFSDFFNVVPSALENLTVSVRQSTVDKHAIQPHTEQTTKRDLAFVKYIIFKRSDVSRLLAPSNYSMSSLFAGALVHQR